MSAARDRRVLPIVALIFGLALAVAGLFFLLLYVAGVVDIIIHQPPDRSWLFWGLGLAFFGVTLLVGGIALLIVWRKTRSEPGAD